MVLFTIFLVKKSNEKITYSLTMYPCTKIRIKNNKLTASLELDDMFRHGSEGCHIHTVINTTLHVY